MTDEFSDSRPRRRLFGRRRPDEEIDQSGISESHEEPAVESGGGTTDRLGAEGVIVQAPPAAEEVLPRPEPQPVPEPEPSPEPSPVPPPAPEPEPEPQPE